MVQAKDGEVLAVVGRSEDDGWRSTFEDKYFVGGRRPKGEEGVAEVGEIVEGGNSDEGAELVCCERIVEETAELLVLELGALVAVYVQAHHFPGGRSYQKHRLFKIPVRQAHVHCVLCKNRRSSHFHQISCSKI